MTDYLEVYQLIIFGAGVIWIVGSLLAALLIPDMRNPLTIERMIQKGFTDRRELGNKRKQS